MTAVPTPTVSVLMPAYNVGRYVAEAARSILGQTFGDFELLVVDDGSTDETGTVLDGLAAADPRVRLTHRPNAGYLSALNAMLGEAKGEFVARMDADDVSMPDRFERQVSYLRAHPECVAVGGSALVIDPDGDPLCEWFPARTHEEIDGANLAGLGGSALCHPSVMMRREAVLAVGGYREPFYTAEDLDLWLRLAERGRLANLHPPLLKYRCHPTSIGHTQKPRQVAAASAAIADARRRRGLPPSPPAAGLGGGPDAGPAPLHHDLWGWWALNSGRTATARKHARASLAKRPLSLDSWRLLYCALRAR